MKVFVTLNSAAIVCLGELCRSRPGLLVSSGKVEKQCSLRDATGDERWSHRELAAVKVLSMVLALQVKNHQKGGEGEVWALFSVVFRAV